MSEEPEIPFAVVPLTIIAGLLSLIYSLYGAVMTFFRIGDTSVHGWGDIYAFVFMSLLSGYKLNRISWLENSCKSDCVLRA
jgi:hypothetical protein